MLKKLTKSQQRTIKLIFTFAVLPLTLVCLFFLGMAVGYKYGGGAAGEVFNSNTWRNIFLIIFG